ncbi:xanthine dehydrogenase molybdopterin binding subunit [Aestuariibius sp. 2305UL40-4]|uniref:xanthine dehydrogenase molybdopterin binding subunit n=1 Tax=Aestuariibius violaceus TaxID=3234132 RepID=UPI00345E91B3
MKDDVRRDVVGRALPHDSAALHVSGRARYVDDLPAPPGCLSLAFGLSEVARGRIVAMDLEAVRAAPGVVTVLTAEDLPFANDVSPSVHDEPLLAEGEVFYAGQPLFVVAAESHLAARAALRLALVEYEQLEPILTVDDALAAGSRFEDGPRIYAKGDVEGALVGAAHVVEGVLEVGGQEHFYLEGQAALALPQEDGMIVHSSTQHPTEIQHKVAEALGLSMADIRVEVRRMGGGFGGKESQGNALAVACAVVARATGRPVRMRYDRDDDFVVTGKRHDLRIAYRAGVDGDGRILGVDFTHYVRCGWSQDLSLPVADRAMLHADNAYLLPAARITSHRLKTNTQSATAFRGFGGPQGMVGIERVMDHAAHVLGVDPVELRRRNYYAERTEGGAAPRADAPPRSISGQMKEVRVAPEGDVASRGAVGSVPSDRGGMRLGEDALPLSDARPRRDAAAEETALSGMTGHVAGTRRGNTTPYGMEVTDFELGAMTARLLETSGYEARRTAVRAWNAGNEILKKGIAFSPVKFGISFTLTHLNQAGALVHVYQDGTIAMNHGGTEMGQGLFRKVAQVAASRFGVDPDVVRITATDTAKVPNTSATAASSGSDLNGMAVKAACDTIRERMAECLGQLYQARPADVVFAEGRVRVGTEEMSFADAAKIVYENRVSLSATGFYRTPKVKWDRIKGEGRPFFYFAHGCAVSEVVIDTLTGENRILRTDILHDCGESLNPALDIGQIEGGFVQGAGWLTIEELVWDDDGRLRTHAPSTYKIPCASDTPDVFNVALWDGSNREETIYRSKAVGEPPFMLGISVWLALSDAVAACGEGYPMLDAPATPERVLMAVRRVRDEL